MNDERMETRVLRALATAAGYRGVLGAPNMRTVGWNWRLRNEFAAGHRDELLRWGSSLSEDEFLRIRNLHRKSWDWLQSHSAGTGPASAGRSGAVRNPRPVVCCYLGTQGHPGPCDFDTRTHVVGWG